MTVPRLDIPDTERLTTAKDDYASVLQGVLYAVADQGVGADMELLAMTTTARLDELIAASIEAAFPVLLKQAAGFNTDRERRD